MAELLISVMPEQTRVALTENFRLSELYVENARERGIVGNIYKGKVVRVLKGMQAVFVDIGEKRTAFLYVDEVRNIDIPELENGVDDSLQSAGVKNNIADMLKERAEILVQVIKEPRGGKGGRLTCYLALPGRYLVLLPNINRIGVSKRIEDQTERQKLNDILEAIKPDNMGLIARTVARGKSEKILKAELNFLLKTWSVVEKRAKQNAAPFKLHEDMPLFLRVIRDLLYPEVSRVIVDDELAYQKIRETFGASVPECLKILELYNFAKPLFDYYGIDKEIDNALETNVWLNSGGFVVIQPTEAMVVVDVNSGKYVGKESFEKTALKVNTEAAKLIAKELRVRNLSGIVVVDFIGVEGPDNMQKVCDALASELKKDRARVSTPRNLSELGLVEFTRQRRYPSLIEMMCKKCPSCGGKGYIKSPTTVVCEILAKLDLMAESISQKGVVIVAHTSVAKLLTERMSESILAREKRMRNKITIEPSHTISPEEFKVTVR